MASTRFNADKGIMDALVHLRKKRGAGGHGEAAVGESALATPLWGMLYADDAGVVSQSPEELREMMGVIVVVCAAFGLTVSEAKAEIMCLRAKGMPESTATFSVEAAGQAYNQTNEFVRLGGKVNQNAELSIEVDRRVRTPSMVQLPEVHPRTVRPTERSPRAQDPDAKSRDTRDNAVRLRHVEPARVPLRHAALSPPQVLDSLCIGWQNNNIADHPISYLDTLLKTGSESIEATLRRRRILFAGFVAHMEDTRLPKCVMFGESVGGAGCVGGQDKEWMGCFLDDLKSFRHQRRPVDGCSRGRGGMAQNGRARGGTFHGEMDRCRENQGWTTACSGMPERDGNNQQEDSLKQAGSCWFARPC